MTTTAEPERPVHDWSERYGPELRRHVAAMVGNADEARDIVQDLWVTALRARPEAGGAVNIRAWLYRVATRRALDHLTTRRRRSELLAAHSGALEPGTLPAADAALGRLSEAAAARVRRCVAALPRRQRDAVWLRWIEQLDYATIARRMGASPEAARANVYQGMKKLRRELAEVWREEGPI
ncbi:MAG: RNA polymerase sigma factor [Gemmatimonadota bacterium]|uniref:RNA polymerase sigma factor n=1 Tax=Candidatus Palauibacter scopulicola TaxID=3056741 RepID=UPI00238754AF|nr:RNA polymerase sigma factor [Candidatus Palauibacter scopulicola]MDE2663852.1 RNA polymerase sigma factor [Candidatus Palauibacter scopulicola]